MDTVDVRELKIQLSRHLKRVRAGTRLLVTQRGRAIAAIVPVEARAHAAWAESLVETGQAHWNGGKPAGAGNLVQSSGRSLSDVVLEQRG